MHKMNIYSSLFLRFVFEIMFLLSFYTQKVNRFRLVFVQESQKNKKFFKST